MMETNQEIKSQLEQCQHEWVVFDTAFAQQNLLLKCGKCSQHATVNDPNEEEWSQGLNSPFERYRWTDNSRVIANNYASHASIETWYCKLCGYHSDLHDDFAYMWDGDEGQVGYLWVCRSCCESGIYDCWRRWAESSTTSGTFSTYLLESQRHNDMKSQHTEEGKLK